jgi:hypothetical protein
MRNCVYRNHTTLQLKLKKQLTYNYYATILWYYDYCVTISFEIQCINK